MTTRRQDPGIKRPGTPPRISAPPRPHTAFRLIVTLCALALLILAGTLVGQRLLEGDTSTPLLSRPESTPHGSFASPPLNTQQINNLRHLSAHMGYKQLASLYVARMPLDEELGQLIMVEYD